MGELKDKAYYESLDKRSKEYREYKKGLGDRVADLTKAVGIKPCEACKKRQAKLNQIGYNIEYFFKRHKPNEFTKEDKKLWEDFRNNNSDKLTQEEISLIIRLTREVLNVSIKPCSSCSSSVYQKWITSLNTVYEH
jgi:hypothetical protein